MFVKTIFVNGVDVSKGSCFFFLGMPSELPGWSSEVLGMRNEVLRCRLINEVRVSRGWEKRAEMSGIYRADFFSGTGITTKPVVISQARDFISATS